MGSQLVQAQWSLNETSDSVYGIARGILQAATSDNVQPLALMACEQFGNTLAISHKTRLRIERTVLPTPEPVTLRFLKVKVGFMKHDCAVQLGSNQAGLRFLALASALISSVSAWRCADALLLMLESTTSDKRLLPTTRHLADLMSSLEDRCRLSGFADEVYGYDSIIVGASTAKGYSNYRCAHLVPQPEGLAALVDACRQLQRVGDNQLISVVVEVRQCAAWVAAFSKWSLELPPSIQFADGTPIISQPGPQFTIIVSPEQDGLDDGDIKVGKKFKLDSIQELVVQCSSSPDYPTYRVTFSTFRSLLLGSCNDQKWAQDAIIATLPFAIKLICDSTYSLDTTIARRVNPEGHTQQFTVTPAPILPDMNTISQTMRFIFGLGQEFPFDSLASVKSFRHLSEVERYLHTMTKYRKIHEQRYPDGHFWKATDPIHDPPDISSRIKHFVNELSYMCVFVVLLSLLDGMEDLHFIPLDHRYDYDWRGSQFYQKIIKLLLKGEGCISRGDVEYEIGTLLRGTAQITERAFVYSVRPHIFWYSILDMVLGSNGILRIRSCRGRLMYEAQVYDEILFPDTPILPEYHQNPPVSVYSATQNLWTNAKTQWQVTTHEGLLYGCLALINRRDPKIVYGYSNPASAIEDLTILLVNCEHPTDSQIEKQSSEFRFVSPEGLRSVIEDRLNHRGRNIFAVGGINELQVFCLGFLADRASKYESHLVVMRRRACLACCIGVCVKTQSRYLIL
ncbi:hypothetical protein F5Y09DRAFT_318568 [Xylaria sp. FL1042]|nr:hypothetical protein F5Y09DRAFT_318568 [Xylaria sp. FL1042]